MYITDEHNPRLPFLRDKTSKLTTSPGVYIMKDKSGKIIYIGKAKNLHNRVTSYFRKGQDHLPKVWKMVSNVNDYEFIVTDSEFEALVLECSLIKLHTPKYNILLKDDKGYSYIRVTKEPFPRIQAVLQKSDDDAEYIGPYTSSFAVKQAVEEANRVFRLPTCTRVFPRDFRKQRPCLNYHIKRCMGVCTGQFSEEEYRQTVEQAVDYIKNGSSQSVERLTAEMERAAEDLEFELAARLRDRITAIQKAAENQKIIDETVPDCDIIAISQNVDIACASVIMYRGGRLTDKADYFLGDRAEPAQMIEEFVLSYYAMKDDAPKNILLEEEPSDIAMLQQYLREKYGHAIYVTVPKRGHLLQLANLAKNNANEFISVRVGRTGREVAGLEELARALGMETPPRFIECYDISNLASSDMVAGMVVFENGRPCKKRYRKFSIKTVLEQNDYACMTEVIERRFAEYFKGEDECFSQKPDLILLDGGNGHVNTIKPVLARLKVDVPLYGLVKDDHHRTRAIATGDGEISLLKSRGAFNLVTQIQDEVHRVAITYQKTKRKKSAFTLELTSVRGVGDKKAQKLITTFKTKEALKKASLEELRSVAGINEETARALKAIIDEMS
ncbi:excinuclease ABC subunit UvrC [Ruminococcus sp.]|uniref:excinuclease ABC subunit UvrC n=1 Tax=Ruminococcus sp. TaxID=41978 RepID=UPI0025D3A0F3|nr:excinuclease ABC subunit UvrC [Ruminococcus sp.]MBQ8966560.1 excinuclease ABC subunit UvrC [Ruminococcus sp.]